MGYDLHITRAEFWAENDDAYIDADEWARLVESDDELTLDPRNGPHFAVWSGPSDSEGPWFTWFEGDIHSRFPDPPTLGKMLQIAERLGARVQGDDGEIYASIDDHPGPRPAAPRYPAEQTSMPAYERRERLKSLLIHCLVAAVILAAIYFDWW